MIKNHDGCVYKASQTSYLEVLQNVLVENVFNIHGLLTVIVGGAVCPFLSLSLVFLIFSNSGGILWVFTIIYHSSNSAAAAPEV